MVTKVMSEGIVIGLGGFSRLKYKCIKHLGAQQEAEPLYAQGAFL